jgi:hypothetical protein
MATHALVHGRRDVVNFPTLPELSEGYGLAALEAVAAGRPVVAGRAAPRSRSGRRERRSGGIPAGLPISLPPSRCWVATGPGERGSEDAAKARAVSLFTANAM